MLGELAVGNRVQTSPGALSSYSRLSANPDALVPQSETAAPCRDCADSYGVALRLRARNEGRMGDAFRELGVVDTDLALPIEAEDDYRYGGRFPDPESSDQPGPQPSTLVPAAPPADNILSADEATRARAGY